MSSCNQTTTRAVLAQEEFTGACGKGRMVSPCPHPVAQDTPHMNDITPHNELSERISAAALAIEDKVIAWRRDIHENPELSYQETRTAALAAAHLEKLGYEVRRGVGITGVVGVLKGGKPGGVVALRADMDALPVEEKVDLPFASRATA